MDLTKVLAELDSQMFAARDVLAEGIANNDAQRKADAHTCIQVVKARQAAVSTALAIGLCMAGRYGPTGGSTNAKDGKVAVGGITDAQAAAIKAWQLNAEVYGAHALPTIEAKLVFACAMAGAGE